MAALVAASFAVSAPTAAGDILPDLGMAPIADIKVDKTQDGRRLLRFTAEIVNVGQGPFELRLHRDNITDPMTTSQRIYTSTGWRDVVTSAQTVFGGDGHNHWHIVNLENTTLIRLDNGSKVGSGVKLGFCFVDSAKYRSLPGSPSAAQYGGCSTQAALDVTMGLSVGWGDFYDWRLPGQYVSLAGLRSGTYTLIGEANPEGVLYEQKTTNNGVFLTFKLRRGDSNSIRVLGRGSRPAEKSVADVSSYDGHPTHPEGAEHSAPSEHTGLWRRGAADD
jgi:hypothetical protein